MVCGGFLLYSGRVPEESNIVMWKPNESAAMKQPRLLTAICWLLFLYNLLLVFSAGKALREVGAWYALPAPFRYDAILLAVSAGLVSSAAMMFGHRWGRWLCLASFVIYLGISILPYDVFTPVALLVLALFTAFGGALFSRPVSAYFAAPGRVSFRGIFGILFFMLAGTFFSFGEMAAFMVQHSGQDIFVKIVMIFICFILGLILLCISMVFDKIRSRRYHTGLAFIAASCGTAVFALCGVAFIFTPNTAAALARDWLKLHQADLAAGTLFCAFITALGAALVFFSRRHESKRMALILLAGLGAASLLFLAVDRLASPVWIGCFNPDPNAAFQSCNSIIQSGHTGGRNLGLAYRERARAAWRLGQTDAALADATKAISLRPNDGAAYVIRGNLYADKNALNAAVADYSKALTIYPNNTGALFQRGMAYINLTQWANAIGDFTHAAEFRPNDENIYLERGFAYASLGKWRQSIADSTKAIALDPGNDMTWNNRCFALSNNGDLKDALSDCNVAIKLGPDYEYSYDSRGFVYLQMKKYDASMSDYTLALVSDPNADSSYYGRALAEQAAGYDATADFAKAKSINPNIASQFDPFLNKAN